MFKGNLEGVLKGYLEGYLEGDLEGDLEVDLEVDLEETSEGTSNRTWKGTCCQAQVRFGPGLVQYSLKFNSFELDSEVGRLVFN